MKILFLLATVTALVDVTSAAQADAALFARLADGFLLGLRRAGFGFLALLLRLSAAPLAPQAGMPARRPRGPVPLARRPCVVSPP